MLALTLSLVAAMLQFPTSLWLRKVSQTVPEPYLDEVFHIRQAQAYWAGNWTTWDPKITTPPGLYLASIIGLRITTPFLTFTLDHNPVDAGVFAIRAFNYSALTILLPLKLGLLLRAIRDGGLKNREPSRGSQIAHTVLNVCLFPVLFFFSALYYTDVFSVLTVLGTCYWHYQQAKSVSTMSIYNVAIVLNGLISLSLRQTNIFWVAIYLGGLQVIRELGDSGRSNQSIQDVFVEGWTQGLIYDPTVDEAGMEDYFNSAVSVLVAAASSVLNLLPTVWPYFTLLASFAAFVAWNGGVVLGDKENHIASLHLTQMLYIWPYVVLFSWPLTVPHLLSLICNPQAPRTYTPRLWASALILTGMFFAVHFNTVIHPFTLADNRHYTFYVFRILCLRHPITKYLVVPIYFLCAWIALITLSPCQSNAVPSTTISAKGSGISVKSSSYPPQRQAIRVSHVLIWLTATALSLITAPLVEPRYFILPWVFWRLHVRVPSATSPFTALFPPTSRWSRLLKKYEHHLWLSLETAWFLLINAVVGYIFIYRGFEWPQEPGKVQRFMW